MSAWGWVIKLPPIGGSVSSSHRRDFHSQRRRDFHSYRRRDFHS